MTRMQTIRQNGSLFFVELRRAYLQLHKALPFLL